MVVGGRALGSAGPAEAQGDSVSAMRAPGASHRPSKAQRGQAELYPPSSSLQVISGAWREPADSGNAGD